LRIQKRGVKDKGGKKKEKSWTGKKLRGGDSGADDKA